MNIPSLSSYSSFAGTQKPSNSFFENAKLETANPELAAEKNEVYYDFGALLKLEEPETTGDSAKSTSPKQTPILETSRLQTKEMDDLFLTNPKQTPALKTPQLPTEEMDDLFLANTDVPDLSQLHAVGDSVKFTNPRQIPKLDVEI